MPKIKMTPEIEKTVADMLSKEPSLILQGKLEKRYSAKDINNAVATKLNIKPDNSPSIRSYEVLLQKLRANKRKSDSGELEQIWTLSSLNEYPLPVETLPFVQLVQTLQWTRGKKPISLRDAKWISRLAPFYSEFNKITPEWVFILANHARQYSAEEKLSEMRGIPFCSYDLDNSIFRDQHSNMIMDSLHYIKENPKEVEIFDDMADAYQGDL